MPYRERSQLLTLDSAPDLLLFWGHRQPGPGYLSQWWPARFRIDGVEYRTAEHYMMAEKARMFGDASALEAVLQAATPALAKKIGRSVRDFDAGRWDQRSQQVVVDGNLAKFGQNPELRDYLLSTAPKVLVEASPHDLIWGIGLAADDVDASLPGRWRGENRLGFALMEVRSLLEVQFRQPELPTP